MAAVCCRHQALLGQELALEGVAGSQLMASQVVRLGYGTNKELWGSHPPLCVSRASLAALGGGCRAASTVVRQALCEAISKVPPHLVGCGLSIPESWVLSAGLTSLPPSSKVCHGSSSDPALSRAGWQSLLSCSLAEWS